MAVPTPTEADWNGWVDEANEALASLSGSAARWWSFGPPCRTFQLVIGDPAGANVAIMLCNTHYVAGPTLWPAQGIRVSRAACRNAAGGWLVEDASVGFRAESRELFWAKDVAVCDPRQWLLWRPTPNPPQGRG